MTLHTKLVRKGPLVTKEYLYERGTLTGHKAAKQYAKDTLVVAVDNVNMDADISSISYMSSVLTLANAEYNEAVASGTEPSDAYDAIYSHEIPWKDADNNISMVKISYIKDVLKTIMTTTASLVGAK